MPRHPVKQPEWIDTAPILVAETIDIEAEPPAVWARIADHASWPDWFEALDKVEPLGAPTGVGGGRRVTVKPMVIDESFTAWDENERFAFSLIATKMPMLHAAAEEVTLAPIDGGTRVTYRQGVEGRRGLGWLMKLAWRPAEKGLAPALAELKRLVEAPQAGA